MRQHNASSTALLMAQSAVICHAEPKLADLVSAESARLARLFVRAHTPRGLRLPFYRVKSLRRALIRCDEWVAGGFLLHFMVRKHFIESEVRRAVARGVQQMVVIGAGFDTLALRLARENPAIRCLEIDHPASQASKLEILAQADEVLPENFQAVPADLSIRPLATVLRETHGFDVDQPAVFVAEGLLMYLPDHAVKDLFLTISRLNRGGATLVFTYMEHPEVRGEARQGRWHVLIDLWLRLIGEPFIWGISPSALPQFVEDLGFQLAANRDSPSIAQEILTRQDAGKSFRVPLSEFVAVATSKAQPNINGIKVAL